MGQVLHFPAMKPEDRALPVVEEFAESHLDDFMAAARALDSTDIETPEQLQEAMDRVRTLVALWPT